MSDLYITIHAVPTLVTLVLFMGLGILIGKNLKGD